MILYPKITVISQILSGDGFRQICQPAFVDLKPTWPLDSFNKIEFQAIDAGLAKSHLTNGTYTCIPRRINEIVCGIQINLI